jgi:hypothetical protein
MGQAGRLPHILSKEPAPAAITQAFLMGRTIPISIPLGICRPPPRRANVSSINTGPLGQRGQQNANDIGSPGSAFDMNFTPLLPSQLLLGSPFQPGTPSTFASPQFASFGSFQHHNVAAQHQNQQNHLNSPIQGQQQHTPVPQLYHCDLAHWLRSPSIPLRTAVANGRFCKSWQSDLRWPSSSMHVTPGMVNGTSRTVYLETYRLRLLQRKS